MDKRNPRFKAGYEHGKAKGSWAFDGNTEDATYRRILAGFEDGDPEVMDICPSPLSGEWAGESIPELSNEIGIDLFDPDNADEFEDGFTQGFWDEVIATAKEMLS
jgi:hypothetical protein